MTERAMLQKYCVARHGDHRDKEAHFPTHADCRAEAEQPSAAAMRAEFEKWVVTRPELTYNGSLQCAEDGYAYGPTEIAWRGWQAGASAVLQTARGKLERFLTSCDKCGAPNADNLLCDACGKLLPGVATNSGAGSQPAAGPQTRFDEFDDDSHPFRKWWKKHGQFMMSGGGRRESIWAARGWIAREQLAEGVKVTGEREVTASAPQKQETTKCS